MAERLNKIGEALRIYRNERKLTLRELSAKTGISASYLSDIERGRTGPGDANQALVTPGHKYGLKPSNILIQEGIVYKDGKPHPLRTEMDVFEAWDMNYIPPRQRSIEAYKKARKPLDPELR